MQRVANAEPSSNRPIILFHKDSQAQISAILNASPPACDVLYFEAKENSHIQLWAYNESRIINIDKDPIPLTSACGFIATSNETQRKISAFQTLLARRLSWIETLRCEELTDDAITAEGVLCLVVSLLAMERQRLLERNAKLLTRAATARRQFEHIQRNMVDLTQSLRLAAPDGLVTAIEYLPLSTQKAGIEAPNSPSRVTCTQRLPIALRGLAGIDLFMDRSGADSEGSLEVQLQSAEDKFTHARWRVTLSSVGGEAIRLALPYALNTLELTPIVSITGTKSALKAVRLGAPHPDPIYCCTVDGKMTLLAPLAMRVRSGIPGRPLSFEIGTILPLASEGSLVPASSDSSPRGTIEEHASAPEKIRARVVSALHAINLPTLTGGDRKPARSLSTSAFAGVRQLSATPADIGFGVVYHWPEKGGVMVHPFVGITTVACVPAALTQPYRRLTVWFESLRNEGPPIEFAAAVGSNDHHAHEILRGDVAPSDVLMSGWSALIPGRTARAEIFTSQPTKVGTNLYLATRLAPGVETHDHAWIVVRSVEMQ